MRRTNIICLTLLAACSGVGKDEGKGVVDDSTPPSIPEDLGKADNASHIVTTDVQSAHPYTNNLDRTYAVSLAGLPSCAQRIRLHFQVLRTEARYDFLTVEGQSFDGNHDDTWTEFFDIAGRSAIDVRLDTDGSVTRHGFQIDAIEWDGHDAACPQIRFPACDANSIDLAPTPGVCGCPAIPECIAIGDAQLTHEIARGRNHDKKHVANLAGDITKPNAHDALVTTTVGAIDPVAVHDLVRRAAAKGLLEGSGYAHALAPDGFYETIEIVAGAHHVTFVASPESHDPEIAALAAEIDALFACGAGAPLTCGSGFTCNVDNATCEETATCICPANYDPVCSDSGHTYSNACSAGCANAIVAHAGECGISGDSCGTILGLPCQDGFRCRYDASKFEAPFPDAGGACVTNNYCDAPADCTGPHPAVVGGWACETNACSWKAGPQWKALAAATFESAHPYASGTSVWKEVTAPAGAQFVRVTATSFSLENNYDFVEMWSWVNGAWKLDRRYTGTIGPVATEEFAGRYHYLRFVSDSSVTDTGFKLVVDWR